MAIPLAKHRCISIGKNLKGFQLSQSRQAVSKWQILVGPQKIFWSALVGPGRRRCLPVRKREEEEEQKQYTFPKTKQKKQNSEPKTRITNYM
jgi:hypothetical protein